MTYRGGSKSQFDQSEKPKASIDVKAHEKREIIHSFLHHDLVFAKLCREMFYPDDDDFYVMDKEIQSAISNDQAIIDNLDYFKNVMHEHEMQELQGRMRLQEMKHMNQISVKRSSEVNKIDTNFDPNQS